jgi:cellulose synthase/poly-beta-1,6-N-acetylglucosamine synthase-like glycosyltransferase
MIDWFTILPVLISAFISISVSIVFASIKQKKTDLFPLVSLVVTSRNEEKDLPVCIQSIENLSYPKNRLEVILVDDRSTDSTRVIIEQAVKKNEHFQFTSTDNYKGHLEAKARGLHCGFEAATGEWVFITDADATLPNRWIESMLDGVDETTGCLSGPLNVPSGSLRGIFEKIAYAFAVPIAYGYSHLFKPFFCLGPNMAIRKEAYDKAGGLEAIDFKVAEDVAIFKMSEISGFKTKYRASKDCLVEISPVPTLGHVASQLTRWIGGAFEHGPKVSMIIAPWFLVSFLCSAVLLFSFLWVSLETYLLAWAVKIFSDTFILIIFTLKTKAQNVIKYAPFFWIAGTISFFAIPFSMLSNRKISWKGDGYEIKYN